MSPEVPPERSLSSRLRPSRLLHLKFLGLTTHPPVTMVSVEVLGEQNMRLQSGVSPIVARRVEAAVLFTKRGTATLSVATLWYTLLTRQSDGATSLSILITDVPCLIVLVRTALPLITILRLTIPKLP